MDEVCGSGGAEYKMVIDNSDDTNAVMIDSVFMELGDTTYSIDSFCIPNGTGPTHSSSMMEWIKRYR